MSRRWLAGLLVVAVIAVWAWPQPTAREIARRMQVDRPADRIRYGDYTYRLRFAAQPTVHAGRLRVLVRADHDAMPIITHEAVVTTGEFSDPALVEIGPLRDGSTWWRAKRRPLGTLVVLHLIPADPAVAERFDTMAEGSDWAFTGYEVIDQRIDRSDGHGVRLGHDNHRFFLVTEARPIAADAEDVPSS